MAQSAANYSNNNNKDNVNVYMILDNNSNVNCCSVPQLNTTRVTSHFNVYMILHNNSNVNRPTH